jgi:DNA repair protein RecO (recombination protein O)
MIHKTRGIVLNHTRFAENSAIVHVFTLELGTQSYMVNGAFGAKKKDKVLLLQPLNLLDMEVYYKSGKEIHRIKEFKLERALSCIPFSQARRAQAFLLTEMLSKVLRNENRNPPLFAFIEDGIEFLDSENAGLENFHLYFLFQLTRFLGFFPHNNYSRAFPFFDMMEGCFISSEPAHPHFLDPDDTIVFIRLFQTENQNLSDLATNVNERRIILNALMTLYELHFQGGGRLRTLAVLSELFKD